MEHFLILGVMMLLIHTVLCNVVSEKLKGSVRGFNNRIIGGISANGTRYPYFTYLRIFFQSGGLGICGGSLVEADVVLTAAHCIVNDGIDTIVSIKAYVNYTESVFFSWNITQYVYTRDAKVWIPNKKYNAQGFTDDIGLVILSEPVFGVSPVKININVDLPTDGNLVTAIGHGLVSQGATPGYTHRLNEVEISVISFDDCNDLDSYNGHISKDANICAGASAGGRGTCRGDSGGPLLILGSTALEDLQVGLTSFSTSICALFKYPDVFTRLSHYTEWIHDNVCQYSSMKSKSCIHSKPTKKPTKKVTKKPTRKVTNKAN
jgi:trypsin